MAGSTLDRIFVECSALGFQSVLTLALAGDAGSDSPPVDAPVIDGAVIDQAVGAGDLRYGRGAHYDAASAFINEAARAFMQLVQHYDDVPSRERFAAEVDSAERAADRVTAEVNRLLQATLENAMLKRDVPGLREIVQRMGELRGIRDVMILEPGGEVLESGVRHEARTERVDDGCGLRDDGHQRPSFFAW